MPTSLLKHCAPASSLPPPACSALSIVNAVPSSPTAIEVTLDPPANSGRVDYYKVTACPESSSECVTATCKSTQCMVPGLTPGTAYNITADAWVKGQPLPTSNSVEVSTPPAGAPALISADDLSSTTAQAVAEPASGVTYTQVRYWWLPSKQCARCADKATNAPLLASQDVGNEQMPPPPLAVHLHCQAPQWWCASGGGEQQAGGQVHGPVPRHTGKLIGFAPAAAHHAHQAYLINGHPADLCSPQTAMWCTVALLDAPCQAGLPVLAAHSCKPHHDAVIPSAV